MIREQAITRQATLTADPVERTRLRLMLARLAEDRKDRQSAQQAIETAYNENSNIAGVVRSTVDYYWRAGDRKRAVDMLADAAARSNAIFKRQFSLEAARKATELGDYARARQLLDPLLDGRAAWHPISWRPRRIHMAARAMTRDFAHSTRTG